MDLPGGGNLVHRAIQQDHLTIQVIEGPEIEISMLLDLGQRHIPFEQPLDERIDRGTKINRIVRRHRGSCQRVSGVAVQISDAGRFTGRCTLCGPVPTKDDFCREFPLRIAADDIQQLTENQGRRTPDAPVLKLDVRRLK